MIDTTITIALDEREEFCPCARSGDEGVDESTLKQCLELASERSKMLRGILDNVLKK